MANDAILAQMLAIRAQVDAAITMLTDETGDCPHPIDSRTDLSEMGGPERFHCHECDQIIEIDEEVDNEGA